MKQLIEKIISATGGNDIDYDLLRDKTRDGMVKHVCLSNVVSGKNLRAVQGETLRKLADFLGSTYGPMASSTEIITGSNKDSILANYSKDGLKVLKSIQFDQPIEMAIQSEIVDIARFVERKVGDGTTSSVIISSSIFDGLTRLENDQKIPPRRLIKTFQECVETLKADIAAKGREITLDDIYKICMISTNGNELISKQIHSLYEQFGFDLAIDVGVSNDDTSKVKIYDGMTIDQGYSDPAYINNLIGGTADIHNPRIYAFRDPIDTPEMVNFLEKILVDNIMEPSSTGEEPIPTVIIAPKITRDASSIMTKLVSILYTYNEKSMETQKPPVLIITNIAGLSQDIYADIAQLCHCKWIDKYIDPELHKAAQEKGEAPTIENISEWYGTCEMVSADADKTKFINPAGLVDENDQTYDMLKNFLSSELNKAMMDNQDATTIHILKKRLRSLDSNMIEYLIGGISISDRDSLKDLVEDAVKNCASAVENGVGRAANFEGLLASYNRCNEKDDGTLRERINRIIFTAYYKAAMTLYGTVVDPARAADVINDTLEKEVPINVMELFEDAYANPDPEKCDVLSSINTDIETLNAISRIITLMVTANQCLLQAPALNRY